MTGYKAMLSDRLPFVVNIALKWCETKGRWVNHVYNSQIKLFVHKSDRDYAVRCVLGIAKRHPVFNFKDTIDWNNLTQEDHEHWTWVQDWVNWFQKHYYSIENAITNSRLVGENTSYIVNEICVTYLKEMEYDDAKKLVEYIIKTIDIK